MDKPEEKLRVRKPEGYYLQKNLELIPKEMQSVLEKVQHSEIKIDSDIIIQGVKNPVVTVFIGLSTRHLIEAIKRKKKRIDNIIIIEPRLDVFKELIMTEDISDLLQDDNIDFLVGLNNSELLTQLFKTLSKVNKGDIISRVGKILNMEKVVDPFVYTDMATNSEAQHINSIIDQTVKHLELSMGCPDDQHRRWQLMIENRHNMFNAKNVTPAWGKFNKTNAIVLGGGPTLDEFIDAYRKHDNLRNCIILAADAVLHKLLENDIKPHVIFRCERKKTQIFKGVNKDLTKGIYYAAYPWTDPSFFDLFDDHIYLFRNNGACVFTEIGHGYVDGGVSSGNAAFEFALNLGCPHIFMAGIDLCMINGKTHTAGTQVEFNPENSKAKWTKIENWGGEQVTTIPVWERCKNEYGQSIDKHRAKGEQFKVYQTSKKSGKILGCEFQDWDACASLSSNKVQVKERLEKYLEPIPQERIDNFYEIAEEALSNMRDIAEGAKVTIELESDAKRTFNLELEKMIRRIKRETEDNPYNMIKAVRGIQANVNKLSKNIADNYDTNFKTKYCVNKFYRICLMDILQYDVFLYENKCNSLTNNREHDDEKFIDYATLTRDFLDRVEFYANHLVNMLEEVVGDNRSQ